MVGATKTLGAAAFETLYAIRMELSFLIALATIWACNRLLCMVMQVKPRPPRDSKKPHRGSRHRSLDYDGDGGGVGGGKGERPSWHEAAARRRSERQNYMYAISGEGGEAKASAAASREQLQDPVWVAAMVQQLTRSYPDRAIDFFRNALASGTRLREMPSADAEKLFVTLVGAAVRIGRPEDTVKLMQDCRKHTSGISVALLSSAVKLCTAKHYFKETLAIFDLASQDRTILIDDRSVWSCILFCAVELRLFARCNLFFQGLKAAGQPSQKDYGNMIRVASAQGDWRWCLTLIEEMRKSGVEIDCVVYNTALATCVAASQNDQAKILLDEMESSEGVADVITYNTLAKGYSKAGQIDKCFELFEHMRSKGIASSQVTYGILLDCCINEKQLDKAAEVFDMMTKEGCAMNTVLYTVMIKGFARADQVDKAMKVYEQMRADAGASPDVITFSILIKANCDAGRMEKSLELLETMMELRLAPDEVVFNNLLAGCIKTSDAALGRRLYNSMVQGGLRPSNATFSIMIRIFVACRQLDEAVEMLRVEPAARGVEAESRLYVQLSQSCLRDRQGRRAVEVYAMMLCHTAPTVAMNGSLLGMCVKLNMLDTAVEILDLAAKAACRVDYRDAMAVREAATRKKKAVIAEAASEAMHRLGFAA